MPQTDQTGALDAIHQLDPTVIINNAPAFMCQPQFSARQCQKIQRAQNKATAVHLKA